MQEQINNAINFIKQQPVDGCIAGSCLLDYFHDQDIDIFLFDKSSFINLYTTLKHNPMFLILDPIQKWSAENLEQDWDRQFRKNKIISIKFYYNTCVIVNLVWKESATNIYGVLSSFDMSIIAKGYDLLTKEELDLTKGTTITKIANWNIYNPKFYKSDLWTMKSILRQFLRIIKYYDRGYNVDLVVKHYIKIIDDIQKMENIFESPKFEEILQLNKETTKIIKQVCITWLETHTITEKEFKLLELKIKEI